MSQSWTAAIRACMAARRPTAAQKTRLLKPATRGVHGASGFGGAVLKCSFLASPCAGGLDRVGAVDAGASGSAADSGWADFLPRVVSAAGAAGALVATRWVRGPGGRWWVCVRPLRTQRVAEAPAQAPGRTKPPRKRDAASGGPPGVRRLRMTSPRRGHNPTRRTGRNGPRPSGASVSVGRHGGRCQADYRDSPYLKTGCSTDPRTHRAEPPADPTSRSGERSWFHEHARVGCADN